MHNTIALLLNDKRLAALETAASSVSGSWQALAGYHHLFGRLLHADLTRLCSVVYELDLIIAVSKVAREKGFGYAQALPGDKAVLRAAGLRHPALDKGIGNDIEMKKGGHVLFLTGANMAGKSTLMKSIGIAVFLAHIGFPVAAAGMQFSVRDGLWSSINVHDNLAQGYSHFYAEVRRVRQVAESVAEGKKLLVIFDELFKGTNVKDAFDATLAITDAFSFYQDCLFVISTHITEAGEDLRSKKDTLQFRYLPTLMEGERPRYTYALQEGISQDRHGMIIIRQEGILDMIREE